MPIYFFDIAEDGDMIRDEEGTDLPDVETAQKEAMEVLPEIARGRLHHGERQTFTSSVRDESGKIVLRAVMSLVAEMVNTSKQMDQFSLK